MKEKIIKIIKESYAGIFISLCLSFMLFFYEPLNLFSSNIEDFWFDIYMFLPIVFFQFLISFIFLSVFFIIINLISKKIYSFLIVCFLIGTICTYIQGNFLAGSLPAMDGTWVDFSTFKTEKIISLLLWGVVGVTLLFVLWKFKFKTYEKVSMYSSLIIIVMLSSSFISIFTTEGLFDRKYNIGATYDNFYDMSSNKNLIVLLIDSTDSKTFYEELEKTGKKNEIFEDFTYYPDSLAGYPFTRNSLPLILSGKWYENEKSYDKYLTEVYDESLLFENLEKQDFNLNLYEYELNEYKGKNYDRFENVISESNINIKELIKSELKIILYKYLPYQLKGRANIDSLDLTASRNKDIDFVSNSNVEFVSRLNSQKFSVEEDNNFKFIHIYGAHGPFYVYDKDLNIVEKGEYRDSVASCVTVVSKFLEKLREENLYDNTAIVIISDHGYESSVTGENRQNPILFVKGINEKHGFIQSDTKVSFEDMVTVFSRLAEGKSSNESFEGLSKDVRRHIIYNYEKPEVLEEYILSDAHAWETDSLKPTGKKYTYK